ncbi:MAG: HAD-IIB family hydrolase, partial [Paraclostridium sp.]
NIGIVSQDVEELRGIELYLKALFNEVLDIYFSSEHTLNLVPKGVSKHEAIKVVCERLGSNLDEVATMGDSPNDISMLKASKYSFAMKKSRSEVKDSAKFEASSVADAIKQIIKINSEGVK